MAQEWLVSGVFAFLRHQCMEARSQLQVGVSPRSRVSLYAEAAGPTEPLQSHLPGDTVGPVASEDPAQAPLAFPRQKLLPGPWGGLPHTCILRASPLGRASGCLLLHFSCPHIGQSQLGCSDSNKTQSKNSFKATGSFPSMGLSFPICEGLEDATSGLLVSVRCYERMTQLVLPRLPPPGQVAGKSAFLALSGDQE